MQDEEARSAATKRVAGESCDFVSALRAFEIVPFIPPPDGGG